MPFIDAVIEDMQTLGDAALDTSSPFDEATVFGEVRGLRMRTWAAECKAHAGDGKFMDMIGKGLGLVTLASLRLLLLTTPLLPSSASALRMRCRCGRCSCSRKSERCVRCVQLALPLLCGSRNSLTVKRMKLGFQAGADGR